MGQERDDTFRKLMQEAGTDKPSADFTKIVMSVVQTEYQAEQVLNPGLKSLLQESAIVEKPGHDFLLRVMSQAEVQQIVRAPVSVAKPIISSRFWYIVSAACVALICLTGFFYNEELIYSDTVAHTTLADKFVTSVVSGILSMPSVYSFSLIALGVLVLIDYTLRTNFNLAKN
jgi:hypothetical protein